MLIRQSRSITRFCKCQVLLTHSPYYFSLFFSPFISFSLLDRFQINLNYIFILSTALYRQLDICRQTRRSCLPFIFFSGSIFVVTLGYRACLSFLFPDQSWWAQKEIVLAFIFCFWIDICSTTLSSDCSLLAHVTDVSALLQHLGWDDQSCYFLVPVSYRCTVRKRSRR